MRKMIQRNIKGKKVLLFFILTNLVYAFMLMVTIPNVMDFSNGMKLMDVLPGGYDLEYVSGLLDALGEAGKNAYLFTQIPVDLIYPFLFGISYCLVLAYFLYKLDKLNSLLVYLCILPLLAGLFDYLENIGIITILINYPDLSPAWVIATNTFTIIKSVTTTIYFVILIIALVIVGIRIAVKNNVSANVSK